MRSVGYLPSADLAKSFSDYLTVQKIRHRIDQDEFGYEVWIVSEDDLQRGKELLKEFQDSPENFQSQTFTQEAQKIRSEFQRAERQNRSRPVNVRTQWSSGGFSMGPVTKTLMGISILVSIISLLGKDVTYTRFLFMSEYTATNPDGSAAFYLPEIMSGEWWRLITPVFLHFGIFHILFNMLWLKDLGAIIESKKGSWFFFYLFLGTAVLPNLAEFFMSGPTFGGMSGVVYGLLGYIWMKGKFDPASGMVLQQGIVIMMIAWFFLCFTGIFGNIANTAHGVGLVVGMIVGMVDGRFFPSGRRAH